MMYTEYPFPQRFAAAARDGFQAVEYLFPYEYSANDLAALLSEHALSQVLFNTPPGDWTAGERGLACLPGREEEFQEGMRRALEYARTLRCPRIHAMAGIAPQGVDRALLRSTYAANLAWAADQATGTGVDVLMEPINTRDIPGYFLNRQAEAHAIAAESGRPNLKVQMDLYHCQIVEGDLEMKLRHYLRAPQNRVGHIQIAGVPTRREPDHGEVNFDYLLDLIDELGFDGWIGCEYRPAAGASEGLGWLRRRGYLPR
jgi:hydroxypyruvate isomerase